MGLNRRRAEGREKQRGVIAGDACVDRRRQLPRDTDLGWNADTLVFSRCTGGFDADSAFLARPSNAGGRCPKGAATIRRGAVRDEWRLAVRIWRNDDSEPEREHEIHFASNGKACGPTRTKIQEGRSGIPRSGSDDHHVED